MGRDPGMRTQTRRARGGGREVHHPVRGDPPTNKRRDRPRLGICPSCSPTAAGGSGAPSARFRRWASGVPRRRGPRKPRARGADHRRGPAAHGRRREASRHEGSCPLGGEEGGTERGDPVTGPMGMGCQRFDWWTDGTCADWRKGSLRDGAAKNGTVRWGAGSPRPLSHSDRAKRGKMETRRTLENAPSRDPIAWPPPASGGRYLGADQIPRNAGTGIFLSLGGGTGRDPPIQDRG